MEAPNRFRDHCPTKPLKPFGRSELSKSVRTFAGGEAALLLDGDKGPLAIDDLPVEDTAHSLAHHLSVVVLNNSHLPSRQSALKPPAH